MTDNTKERFLYILVISFLFSLFFLQRCGEENLKESNHIIDSLKTENAKLYRRIDTIDNKIKETKTVINNIIKEKEVKLIEVDKMSNPELTKYFKERYEHER